VMSGLLISRRAIYWSVSTNALIFLVLAWSEATGRLPAPDFTVNLQQPIIFTAASLLTAVLLNLALQRQQEALEQVRSGEEKLAALNIALEIRVNERTRELSIANQQVEKRARQLQVVAEVARTATSIQELNQLLNPLTGLISQRFGIYHVGIFLLDEQNQYAVLEASNTEGGLVMLKRGHRLKVGEQGIVGFVTSRGEPRIALDVGQDAVFFDNPDLPDTRSELALPLKISNKIIGALDLQSTEERAFTEEDVSVLAILADQVAIAIQNARSAERARRALLEAEIATKQLSGEAWKGYATDTQSRGYRYDGVKPEPLNKGDKLAEDKDALWVPVQLRGQTIGRLKLKGTNANHKWTEDERAIIESTADRVALAMESARLLDEAQKRATRESFLSEIGTKLGASFQLDSILRDTVEELGQTLKGSTVSFQLVNPSAPPTANSSKSDAPPVRRKKTE
jgi:GAF domain-containing protein